MVTKYYKLDEAIEQCTRIEDRNLKITKKILIEYTGGEPGYLPPAPEARGYYKITIETFNKQKLVV